MTQHTEKKDVIVAGTGALWIAPAGTPTPASLKDELNAAFFSVGYTHEDGATYTVDETYNRIGAWQTPEAIRMTLTETDVTWELALRQLNVQNLQFLLGEGVVNEPDSVNDAGSYRYTQRPSRAPKIYAVVLDFVDGDTLLRWSADDVQLTEVGEMEFGPEDGVSPTVTLHKLDGEQAFDCNRPSWAPAGD